MSAQVVTVPSSDMTRTYVGAAILFMITALLLFGAPVWDMYRNYQAGKVLEGPALGAKLMYQQRQSAFHTILGVAREVEETRSPGRYIAALNLWRAAVAEDVPASPEAAWLTQLRKEERSKAQALLAEHSVTLDKLTSLTQELSRISPQLSAEDEALLNTLTSNAFMKLAFTKSDTTGQITEKLVGLGVPRDVVNRMGFW